MSILCQLLPANQNVLLWWLKYSTEDGMQFEVLGH